MNSHNRQTIVEVASEGTIPNTLLKNGIRGGDHPYIYLPLPVLPQLSEGSGIQYSEQLYLHVKRKITYFVKEEGASVSLLQKTIPGVHNSRVSPRGGAEEL